LKLSSGFNRLVVGKRNEFGGKARQSALGEGKRISCGFLTQKEKTKVRGKRRKGKKNQRNLEAPPARWLLSEERGLDTKGKDEGFLRGTPTTDLSEKNWVRKRARKKEESKEFWGERSGRAFKEKKNRPGSFGSEGVPRTGAGEED